MILLILVTLFSVGCYADRSVSSVAQTFKDNNIVPNIILKAPENLIRVNYPAGELNLGKKFYPTQTLLKPDVDFDAEDDELYTLVFFGPDLPPDIIPPYTQFLHWLIVNIPGTNLEGGDAVSPYFPPTPYPGDFHYIFLLYKQNASIDVDQLKHLSIIISRPGFDVIEFQKKYKLTGPLAGNFMKEVYLPTPDQNNTILGI